MKMSSMEPRSSRDVVIIPDTNGTGTTLPPSIVGYLLGAGCLCTWFLYGTSAMITIFIASVLLLTFIYSYDLTDLAAIQFHAKCLLIFLTSTLGSAVAALTRSCRATPALLSRVWSSHLSTTVANVVSKLARSEVIAKLYAGSSALINSAFFVKTISFLQRGNSSFRYIVSNSIRIFECVKHFLKHTIDTFLHVLRSQRLNTIFSTLSTVVLIIINSAYFKTLSDWIYQISVYVLDLLTWQQIASNLRSKFDSVVSRLWPASQPPPSHRPHSRVNTSIGVPFSSTHPWSHSNTIIFTAAYNSSTYQNLSSSSPGSKFPNGSFFAPPIASSPIISSNMAHSNPNMYPSSSPYLSNRRLVHSHQTPKSPYLIRQGSVGLNSSPAVPSPVPASPTLLGNLPTVRLHRPSLPNLQESFSLSNRSSTVKIAPPEENARKKQTPVRIPTNAMPLKYDESLAAPSLANRSEAAAKESVLTALRGTSLGNVALPHTDHRVSAAQDDAQELLSGGQKRLLSDSDEESITNDADNLAEMLLLGEDAMIAKRQRRDSAASNSSSMFVPTTAAGLRRASASVKGLKRSLVSAVGDATEVDSDCIQKRSRTQASANRSFNNAISSSLSSSLRGKKTEELIGKKRKPATENGAKDSGSVPKAAKQSEPVPTMEVAEVSETPKKQDTIEPSITKPAIEKEAQSIHVEAAETPKPAAPAPDEILGRAPTLEDFEKDRILEEARLKSILDELDESEEEEEKLTGSGLKLVTPVSSRPATPVVGSKKVSNAAPASFPPVNGAPSFASIITPPTPVVTEPPPATPTPEPPKATPIISTLPKTLTPIPSPSTPLSGSIPPVSAVNEVAKTTEPVVSETSNAIASTPAASPAAPTPVASISVVTSSLPAPSNAATFTLAPSLSSLPTIQNTVNGVSKGTDSKPTFSFAATPKPAPSFNPPKEASFPVIPSDPSLVLNAKLAVASASIAVPSLFGAASTKPAMTVGAPITATETSSQNSLSSTTFAVNSSSLPNGLSSTSTTDVPATKSVSAASAISPFAFGSAAASVANGALPVASSIKQPSGFSFSLAPATTTQTTAAASSDASLFSFGGAKTTSTSSPFGTTASTTTATPFGASTATATPFGATASTTTATPFGATASTTTATPFGTAVTTTTATPFGKPSSTTTASLFGGPSATTTASPFGAPLTTTTASPFGASSTTPTASPFGAPATTSTASPFGAPATTTSASPFGAPATTSTASPFGAPATTTSASLFGAPATISTTSPFGAPSTIATASPFGAALTTTTVSPFGAPSTTSTPFGTSSTTTTSTPFGVASTTKSASPFGTATTSSAVTTAVTKPTFAFGSAAGTTFGGAFGVSASTAPAAVFSGGASSPASSAMVFGAASSVPAATPSAPPTNGSMFGGAFGGSRAPAPAPSVFGATASQKNPAGGIGVPANTNNNSIASSTPSAPLFNFGSASAAPPTSSAAPVFSFGGAPAPAASLATPSAGGFNFSLNASPKPLMNFTAGANVGVPVPPPAAPINGNMFSIGGGATPRQTAARPRARTGASNTRRRR